MKEIFRGDRDGFIHPSNPLRFYLEEVRAHMQAYHNAQPEKANASDQVRLQPSPEAGCSVIEMGLCEVQHIMLRPNQLYRFVVMPDCEKCKALDVYSPNAKPGERPPQPEETTDE